MGPGHTERDLGVDKILVDPGEDCGFVTYGDFFRLVLLEVEVSEFVGDISFDRWHLMVG